MAGFGHLMSSYVCLTGTKCGTFYVLGVLQLMCVVNSNVCLTCPKGGTLFILGVSQCWCVCVYVVIVRSGQVFKCLRESKY